MTRPAEPGTLVSMGRGLLIGVVAVALLAWEALALINTHEKAVGTALHEAQSVQPRAHWSVMRESLEPWANDVDRGGVRLSDGTGPAWVVELSAPGDSTWTHYSAVVVINAVTGRISGASVLGSNLE